MAALAALRLWLGAHLDLLPDEAYYWSWSLLPDWCYWDQPGGVAWAHVVWRAAFGDGLVSLRALAACCAFAASLATYALYRRTLGEGAAWRGALIAQTLPMFAAGAALILHDSLLLAFGAFAWLLWAKALLDDRPRWWLLVGLALTAALYAKFSALTLALGIFAGTLGDPTGRRHLRTVWPYAAAALTLALFSPVLVWNKHHQWAAYYAVVKLAFDPTLTTADRALSTLDFLGGQLLVATPILAVLAAAGAAWAVRTRRESEGRGRMLLATPSIVILVYFLWNSWRAKIQANWAALAWIGLVPLGVEWAMARAAARHGSAGVPPAMARRRQDGGGPKWLWAGVALAAAASLAITLQCLVDVARVNFKLTDQFFGWNELAQRVQQARIDAGDPRMPVMTGGYQEAAELTRHLPDRPLVYTLDFPRRGSQFTLWENFDKLVGRDVLYVDHWVMPREMWPHFASLTDAGTFERRRGARPVETYRLSVARSFKLDGPLAPYLSDPVAWHVARVIRTRRTNR